jgi:hypothetical protein
MKSFWYIVFACASCVLGYIFLANIPTLIVPDQSHFAWAEEISDDLSRTSNAIYRVVGGQGEKPERHQFCPSDASVSFARTATLISFNPALPGGAHTWVFNGSEVVKALAAYCGDSRLNANLLVQLRHAFNSYTGPTATGGYQDQKQLGVAFMFLLAKRTPAIWDQLSAAEHALVDLNMEALMYSSTFTTKDEVATSLGMNGDTNVNRDWNPNYQNGMVGMIIAVALYWGFEQLESKLATYSDAAFEDKLRANGMKNLLSTYANPARPQPATIQAGLRKLVDGAVYRFHGISDRNLLGLFNYIASRTFSAEISCGLNGGAGIGGYGRVVKNCDLLPNVGRRGMILEFDGWDAEGRRSSSIYSWDAWYPLNYIRAALQIDGWLTSSALQRSATLAETMNRYSIGSNDLWFKISPDKGGGYKNYQHGKGGATVVFGDHDHGARANLDLFNILQRNLGLPAIEK